ncbi:MAG: DNA polymerase IV [Acidimicrobiia bacterium]
MEFDSMILLADMDAFFASVEQAHHPHLRGRPVIVCGDPSRRGVVTAASYEARSYGVRAGMPLGRARSQCPNVLCVEGNPDKYVSLSLQLLDLYLRHTPDIEPFSVDEAFLDLGKRTRGDQAIAVARQIQSEVRARFELGVSIGIGPNKLIAKMAASLEKPCGLQLLDPPGFREVFAARDVVELWGVGPKIASRMRSLGIKTVGDLARAPRLLLEREFGVIGPQLREAANGHDQTPLVPYHRGLDAKSIGHEVTLTQDCSDLAILEATLLRLSDQVGRRMRREGYAGRTVTLKIRAFDFTTLLRQKVLPGFTLDHREVFDAARELWRRYRDPRPVRLLGVTVSGLVRCPGIPQRELFSKQARADLLTRTLDGIRDRLGEAALVPAGTLSQQRSLAHVPFGTLSPRSKLRPAPIGTMP